MNDMTFLPPEALIREGTVHLQEIIDFFEGGAENIYLVDSEGRYRWGAVRRSQGCFARVQSGGWKLTLTPVPPLVFDPPVNQKQTADLQLAAEQAFKNHPGFSELPVVNSGGAIVSVVRTDTKSPALLDWTRIDIFADASNLMPQGRVCLSSRKSKLLNDFYEHWHNRLQLEFLKDETCEQVLSGKSDCTLVYEHDIFPACAKVSVQSLYDKLYGNYFERRAEMWYLVRERFASIAEHECGDFPLLVSKFDAGYEAVYVQGQDGLYKGTVNVDDFRKKFPREGCAEFSRNFVSYTGDPARDKRSVAEALDGTPHREIAMLKDGKVVASGCVIVDAGSMNRQAMWEQQHPYWELISDEVALDFFGQRRRVMLSSESGDLSGFRQRFGSFLNISVYNGDNYSLYNDGQVDMLLYGATLWSGGKAPAYYARQLYADLVAEDMRRYFSRNGIGYYCLDIMRPVAGQAKRMVSQKNKGEILPFQVWSGLAEDYYAHVQCLRDDMAKALGGHRLDAPAVSNYTRSIYMYGPCTAVGYGANYGETVEARLQELCLASGRRWRTVNCGGGGISNITCDLNSLNWMMHTHMRRGDIVVHLSGWMWKSPTAFHPEGNHFYWCSDAFDDEEHRNQKYFWSAGLPAHMSPEGYEVLAGFLAKKMFADQGLAMEPSSRENIAPFFSRMGESLTKNQDLRAYLADLATHRQAVNGAIVMNANPFTLGHLHLVEYARREVPYLYVFVVQEDASDICFVDRLEMVCLGCADMDNVKVLPSGRYMISALTFPEYFEKQQHPDQTVFPSKDIVLFGEAIAPTLGIAKRFVGEEPLDRITHQYNEAMARLLPDYGVELVQVPRLQTDDGTPINATQVRALLQEGKLEKCRAYLPKTTLTYIKEHGLCGEVNSGQ